MQTFLEGAPGSGKSYCAIKNHLIPHVQKGGRVVTNIKGINHEEISLVTGKTFEDCQALVTCIPWDDTLRIDELCGNDALVIIDEVQDFWPTKSKMTPAHTAFITQHRQRGLELVTVGQSMKDVHHIFRNRVNKRIYYLNQDAVGLPGQSLFKTYNCRYDVGRDKIISEEVSSGTEKYEAKYWNCYKSHALDVENVDRPKDDRFNVFKTSVFKIWVPVFLIVLYVAGHYLWGFFHDPKALVHQTAKQQVQKRPTVAAATVTPAPAQPVITKPLVAEKPQEHVPDDDYINGLMKKYRPRLSGFITAGNREDGIIEFLDVSYRAQERVKLSELHNFGWEYHREGSVIFVTRDLQKFIVTAWPVEPFGQASQAVRNSPSINGKES